MDLVSPEHASTADLCKIPHNDPFSRLMTPNLFGYFLLFWPSSSEPSLGLQCCWWEWRWRCPMEKGSRLQLFSALFPSPLQVNPSIFPLLSFLSLTWCFHEVIVITPKCITALVTMLPLHRFSCASLCQCMLLQLTPTAPPSISHLLPSHTPQQLQQPIPGQRSAGSCS